MALKTVCALTLLGRTEAVLSATCLAAVNDFFNSNTAAGAGGNPAGLAPNAQSPKCTLPLEAGLGVGTLTAGEDGSLYTTRAAADKVCPAMLEIRHQNMCSDPCDAYLENVRRACDGQIPIEADRATLPSDGVSGTNMALTYWTNWFGVMNKVETLCQNACLVYYCANKDRTGFEALTPACSTTTTTVTDTSTVTETLTVTVSVTEELATMAPLAPTTPVSTIAPAAVIAPVAAQGSMPGNLAAAQAIGNQAAVIGAAGLLNSYSQVQVVHPGWIVGAVGILGAAVAMIVVKRRSASPTEELEALTTPE